MEQKITVQTDYQQQKVMHQHLTSLQMQIDQGKKQQQKNTQVKQFFSNVEQALLATQQAVQQIETAYPSSAPLQHAKTALTNATSELAQLKETFPSFMGSLPPSTKQQIKQLENDVMQAGQTLSLIQL